ncbi:Serine/arginine-rich splicing factor RSZ23 [Hibiscus syriacus]|uniref:Serine/arginine-rich splicing factor RSZ23 n=1 Tax=Hibiscus syriacus TaxID=106335 RepID=A0A6A3B3S2_HIBSY|nr:Serine/arginine-rich splicing factor RSZ23 [Hibiscus syriacus]
MARVVWVARRPPGYAFIDFDDRRDAEDAIRELDGASTLITGMLNLEVVGSSPWRVFHNLEVSYGSCSQPSVGIILLSYLPLPLIYGNKGQSFFLSLLSFMMEIMVLEHSVYLFHPPRCKSLIFFFLMASLMSTSFSFETHNLFGVLGTSRNGWRVELSHNSRGGGGGRGRSGGSDLKCYECGEPGHFARDFVIHPLSYRFDDAHSYSLLYHLLLDIRE